MAKIPNGTTRKASPVSVKQGAAKMGEFMQKRVTAKPNSKESGSKGTKRN